MLIRANFVVKRKLMLNNMHEMLRRELFFFLVELCVLYVDYIDLFENKNKIIIILFAYKI